MVGTFSFAQSSGDEEFTVKGKVIVETGYNISGVVSNSTGSNTSLDFNSGSKTAIGADMGIMLSNNFALNFKLGLLNSAGSLLPTSQEEQNIM